MPDKQTFALFVVRWLFYSLLGVGILTLNPFGLGDVADQASQDAFYKVMAPLYQSSAQEDILVVLQNDRTIDALHRQGAIRANEWPLLYQDHGVILERLGRYNARAVFVDVYFKKERSIDNSLPRMERRLQRAQERFKTRYLFAGGYSDEELTPIQKGLDSKFGLTVNGWEGYEKGYPLRDRGRYTSAYELYRIACLGDSPLDSCAKDVLDESAVVEGTALSVRWGSRPAPPPFPEVITDVCSGKQDDIAEMARQLFWGLVNDFVDYDGDQALEVPCPYQQVLFADDLLYIDKMGTPEQKERLRSLVENKIILYGLHLEGLHDVVHSPVHGLLPGVMLHAMALDNLIADGQDVVRAADEELDRLNQWAWVVVAGLISLLLLFIDMKGKVNNKWMEHSRGLVVVFGIFAIIVLASGMFFILRYEPLNSIGYLALLGIIGQFVNSELTKRVVVAIELVLK
ncbi:MAG: CHASE2 domain-containing protein [Chromatiales bacterium]|nr:CHASE2 domain-containing protein [Gammaproteobacteria bacterium]